MAQQPHRQHQRRSDNAAISLSGLVATIIGVLIAAIGVFRWRRWRCGREHRHSRAADDTTAVVSQLVNIPSHVSSPTDVAAADSITAGPNDRTTPLPVHTLAINDGILCHCQEVSPAPYKPSAASRLDNAVALPNIHSCPVSVPQLPPPPPVPITSPLPLQQPDMFQTYTSNYHRCKSLPRTSTWPLGQSPHQTAAARTNMEI